MDRTVYTDRHGYSETDEWFGIVVLQGGRIGAENITSLHIPFFTVVKRYKVHQPA